MITEQFTINTRVLSAMMNRMYEEQWPAGVEMGLPFRTENGDMMRDVTVCYADDFPLGEKISEIINQMFNLNEQDHDSTRTY